MFKVRFTSDGINFYNSEFERLSDAKKFAAAAVEEGFRSAAGAVIYDAELSPIHVAVNFDCDVMWFDN